MLVHTEHAPHIFHRKFFHNGTIHLYITISSPFWQESTELLYNYLYVFHLKLNIMNNVKNAFFKTLFTLRFVLCDSRLQT